MLCKRTGRYLKAKTRCTGPSVLEVAVTRAGCQSERRRETMSHQLKGMTEDAVNDRSGWCHDVSCLGHGAWSMVYRSLCMCGMPNASNVHATAATERATGEPSWTLGLQGRFQTPDSRACQVSTSIILCTAAVVAASSSGFQLCNWCVPDCRSFAGVIVHYLQRLTMTAWARGK